MQRRICRWLLRERGGVLVEQKSYRQAEHELLGTLSSGARGDVLAWQEAPS